MSEEVQKAGPKVTDPNELAAIRSAADANVMSSGTAPTMNDGMTFMELGTTGLRAFGGWVKEEFLTELQGRQGAQKYREMVDTSPIVNAVMFSINSTMRKVAWRVEPVSDRGDAKEAADFLESCMEDMSMTWEDLVIENLSALQYGYAPHELVYKRRLGKKPPTFTDRNNQKRSLPKSDYDDGAIGWRRIPLRGQDTVLKWFFDETGQVSGMTQMPYTGVIRDLPIEKMLLFRASSHKGNPEGRSILRSAYVPYYYVKRLQEMEAIMGERMGGVPVVSVPLAMIDAANNGDAKAIASMNSFKKLAVNLRVDEQMGVVMPSDTFQGVNGPTAAKQFSLELVTPAGGRGSALNFEAAIGRYNINIMTSVLADFLSLGHEARGTQSLAVTKVDLFFQAVEGFLNSFASVYNRYAVPRLWELNNRDPNLMPEIVPDLAQRVDLDVLSNFVLRLSQSGMPMFPNDDLQTFLLDAAGMPDIQDPRALQAAGVSDDQLNREDEKDQTVLDNMQNPPEPEPGPKKPASNLEKMILAGIAKRMVRNAGPRFGIHTGKNWKRRSRRRA